MNVYEIVKQYLKENGYDGLCNSDAECGCNFDHLMVCESCCADCVSAYNHGEMRGYDYYMSPEKPKTE